ncbi:MAG: hypothetical protein AAB619_01760, partial [Patescibacteria group bacterium]
MGKPFKGTTEEGLAHYLASLPRATTRAGHQARQPIIAYCRCTTSTVRRWTKGEIKPLGLMLVRVRYFLASQGYCVVELERLDPAVRRLGQLIAEEALTADEARVALKYEANNVILELLHGRRQLNDVRQAILVSLLARHQSHSAPPPDATSAATESSPPTVPPTTDDCKTSVMAMLAGFVQGAIPLAEFAASDRFTDADRERLRQLCGGGGMFHLSNLTAAL